MNPTPNPAGRPAPVFAGLLWRERMAHGGVVDGFIAAWLALVFILEACPHPAVLLAFGVLYAIVVGAASGGAEAAEGVEEFAFALPATRHQRYLARLAFGGGILLALQLAGVATLALDLPPALWSLVVESGFTAHFPAAARVWYVLAVVMPVAVFAGIFAGSANAHGRTALPVMLGLGAAPAVAAGGFLAEHQVLGSGTGYLSCLALALLAVVALVVGHHRYVRKEGVPRSGSGGGRLWLWLLLTVGLVLVVGGFLVLERRAAVPVPPGQGMESSP